MCRSCDFSVPYIDIIVYNLKKKVCADTGTNHFIARNALL